MTPFKIVPQNGCATCGHKLCARKVSLFSNMDDLQLQTLLTLIERKHYKKGDVVLNQGDTFERLYIINSGGLKASTFGEDGKEQILYILNEGDSIGELSLLKRETAPYNLITIKPCHLCTIPKDRFDSYLKENPEMMFSILESAHEKITSLENLVTAISSSDADVRLKFLIQRLCKQSGKITPEGIVLTLALTREDMANFVGVTRETISRKLSSLNANGLIDFIDQKTIMIKSNDYFDL
ncbi:Crp/Fnr family transcriptional regulator [Fusibacter sp. 3D3]|uniref:Crp/Fnr family transcriptional regulator n=1 Tax=Fusibacter sp. 3D3 TaxID=1048380 RepID=UPI000853831F|nr:Crp/Fnr family transcriptional regulator [Fusibacter sp. 3D3]GAU78354.1 transcriptional regulator, Crp/Fnr family [Fusibacter sp. 3D3]